jgi:hypothetical protein
VKARLLNEKYKAGSMSNILLVVLVLLIVGVFPVWPHSANWGYYPGGGLSLILVIALIFVFSGRGSLN